MIKMVDVLVRNEGLTHEEFLEHWFEEHVPLAKQLPGLQKYVTSVPTDPVASKYDGIAELYFESPAAIEAAFDSEIGHRTHADASEFIDLEKGPTQVVEETVQLDSDT